MLCCVVHSNFYKDKYGHLDRFWDIALVAQVVRRTPFMPLVEVPPPSVLAARFGEAAGLVERYCRHLFRVHAVEGQLHPSACPIMTVYRSRAANPRARSCHAGAHTRELSALAACRLL